MLRIISVSKSMMTVCQAFVLFVQREIHCTWVPDTPLVIACGSCQLDYPGHLITENLLSWAAPAAQPIHAHRSLGIP